MAARDGEQIARFIETAPDATIIVDGDGVIAFANTRAGDLFGYDHGELIGEPVEILLPESVREVHVDQRREYQKQPSARPMGAGIELVGRRRDGSTFSVDISLGPVEIDGATHVAAAVRDVTDQIEAHRAAVRLGFIVESSDDAIYSLDRDGRVTTWNRAAELLAGRRAPDVRGTEFAALLPPHHRAGQQEAVRRVLAGERIERLQTELERPDGLVIPVSVTMSSLRDRSGTIVGVTAIARDITEQVQSQEMLSNLQTILEETQRLASIGLWVWDADGDSVQWSQVLHGIAGLSPLDFDGTFAAHLAVIDPEQRAGVETGMRAALRAGEVFESEYSIVRPDGTARWVLARGEPVTDSGGRVIGLRGICQDLTDRHEALEQLRLADRMKDEFLATVSHELRTPLTAILGFAKLMAKRVDDEELVTFCAAMSRNADEMHGMVERLLDFSRMQGGRLVVNPEPLQLRDAVTAALRSVEAQAAAHRVEIDIDPGIVVMADPHALTRIMSNLVGNSTKFAPEGTVIEISAEAGDTEVTVNVIDDGPGIPADELESVFERFHQVADSQVSSHRGTGVGLSIVERYVTLLGGRVWAGNHPARGAHMRFTLPLTQPLTQPRVRTEAG